MDEQISERNKDIRKLYLPKIVTTPLKRKSEINPLFLVSLLKKYKIILYYLNRKLQQNYINQII